MEFPTTDAQKRAVLASTRAVMDDTQHTIGYNTVLRGGDTPGSTGMFGLILDEDGDPVLNEDSSQLVSDAADFTSILQVGSRLWSVTHFESRPGGMYLTELSQNAGTGKLTAMSTASIDMSGVDGLWVPCAGSVTPWNTHLHCRHRG